MSTRLGSIVFVTAACGGVISSPQDAGDASASGAPCVSAAECGGLDCVYSIHDGCNATKQCLPPPNKGACKAMPYCACDGTEVLVCSEGTSKPVVGPGPCADAQPPPPICTLPCEVCDLNGFVVPVQAKPNPIESACTPQQLSDFVTACYSTQATQATCSMWDQQNDGGACASCLTTQSSASAWGAFVCTPTTCEANIGGCVDLELGQVAMEKSSGGTTSCGDLYTTELACVDYACGACTSDFNACDQAAMGGECAALVDATHNPNGLCKGAIVDAGASKCFLQSDADALAFVNVFCGTGP